MKSFAFPCGKTVVLALFTFASSAWLSVGAQTEIRNGDVNGDGSRDIVDVIALASYLFSGTAPPMELVCEDPEDPELAEPPSVFENQFYGALDLERAAREQYGLTATLVSTGDHLYDWKVRVGRVLQPLDIARAATSQYGASSSAVAVGVHAFDWKAFHFGEPQFFVLPVMLVASDRFFDIAGVARAVNRFRSVLGRVQGWYNARVDARLRFLQPLVISTGLTSAQWNTLSDLSAEEAHRYDLLDTCIQTYESQLPAAGSTLRIVFSIYTGESAEVWLGAASVGSYAMAPPRATSLDCPAAGPLDARCADAAYAIGHELGHTFGLGHTCDEFPANADCSKSIMQVGRPPSAILLQREVCILLDVPFFHAIEAEDPRHDRLPLDWRR